jgi:CheY-like chemotaxis protein
MKVSPSPNGNHFAHILMVDDHAAGLRARRAILEQLGYRVAVANGAEEALKEFAKETFDMVVTDFKMPKVNGVQLIERLRKLNSAIPIILLSGFADVLGLTEAGTGADLVLAKDSREVEHLIRGVARLLRPKLVKKPPTAARPASKAKASSQ